MVSKKQSSIEEKTETENSYFELQAYWGMTKHMGGLKATRQLVELCHISEDKYVLVVGCGVGVTPCYLVKRYGCRVVGVDLSDKMIHIYLQDTWQEPFLHQWAEVLELVLVLSPLGQVVLLVLSPLGRVVLLVLSPLGYKHQQGVTSPREAPERL